MLFSNIILALIYHPFECAVITIALLLIYFAIVLYVEKRFVNNNKIKLKSPGFFTPLDIPPASKVTKIEVQHYGATEKVLVS